MRVVVVGLEFGAEFVPIYADHPGVTSTGIADLLPEPIRKYTREFTHAPGDGPAGGTVGHRSFVQGGGHGGSHPHLVHEFVSSVLAGRAPFVDDLTAANWTATGLAAHESARRGGERITVPDFDH